METTKLGPSPEIYYPLLGERGMGKGPKFQMCSELTVKCRLRNLRGSRV